MLIARVTATPLSVPLLVPYHWRFGDVRCANLLLVCVESEDGLRGYGECVFDYPQAAELLAHALYRPFIGRRVHETARIRQEILQSGRWRTVPRLTNLLLAGIEVACWDLFGQSLGVPVSELLGGRVRDTVDFVGFVQGDGPNEIAATANALCEAGFDRFYVKVGRESERDFENVRMLRETVGDNAQIRIDANEAWTVRSAIEHIRKLDAFHLEWVEQPVAGDDIEGLAYVRSAVAPAIAADNAVYSAGELRAVIAQRAADAVVLSTHEAGGLACWTQMAAVAAAANIPLNRKGHLESAISTHASLQAMAVIPNLATGNQLTHQLLDRTLTTADVPLRDGAAAVPAQPGFGFTIDDSAVADAHERHRVEAGRHGYGTGPILTEASQSPL